MSMTNIESMKQNNAVLWWNGSYAESGAYDDDGNKRGFLILPDGVTVTPTGTFTTQKMKDGRNIWKFDGSTNYITLSNNTNFNLGANDFVIAFWLKVSIIPSSGVSFIIWYGTDTQFHGIQLRSGGSIGFHAYTTSAYLWNFSSAVGSIALNTWTHVICIRTGSYQAIYINTSQSGGTATSSGALNTHSNPFYISGCSYPYGNPNYITGNIKDLMIFKKALTQDQIAAIYRETYIY